jgi:hypothetical protein
MQIHLRRVKVIAIVLNATFNNISVNCGSQRKLEKTIDLLQVVGKLYQEKTIDRFLLIKFANDLQQVSGFLLIKFANDLQQVSGFLQFPLTATSNIPGLAQTLQ